MLVFNFCVYYVVAITQYCYYSFIFHCRLSYIKVN